MEKPTDDDGTRRAAAGAAFPASHEKKLELAARARGILASITQMNSVNPSAVAEFATELPPGFMEALRAVAVPEGELPTEEAVRAARDVLNWAMGPGRLN